MKDDYLTAPVPGYSVNKSKSTKPNPKIMRQFNFQATFVFISVFIVGLLAGKGVSIWVVLFGLLAASIFWSRHALDSLLWKLHKSELKSIEFKTFKNYKDSVAILAKMESEYVEFEKQKRVRK